MRSGDEIVEERGRSTPIGMKAPSWPLLPAPVLLGHELRDAVVRGYHPLWSRASCSD